MTLFVNDLFSQLRQMIGNTMSGDTIGSDWSTGQQTNPIQELANTAVPSLGGNRLNSTFPSRQTTTGMSSEG